MELFAGIIDSINSVIWSNALVVVFLGAGIFLSCLLVFPQVRHLGRMVRLAFSGGDSENGVSAYAAFATTVGSRVGMGNVAGVATAIFFGGPGAVVWMWVCSIVGAASSLVESTLAQAYKVRRGTEYVGGPFFYIERALGSRALGVVFAVITIVGIGIMCPGLHTYTISSSFNQAFGIPTFAVGLCVIALIGLVIFGGVRRITKVAEFLAPIMCVVYILFAIAVMVRHASAIPGVIASMFASAVGADPLFGGLLGTTVAWGIKRGVYSSEAGMGSGCIVSAAAHAKHPAEQGLVQAFSVLVDTLVICTASAMIILCAGTYNVQAADGATMLVENVPGVEYGVLFVQRALEATLGSWSGKVLAICLVMFVFTSLMGYYYESEASVNYMTGGSKLAINAFRVIFMGAMLIGVVASDGSILWSMGDIGSGLMAWMNVIVILVLAPKVRQILRDYEEQVRSGEDVRFDPEKFGIDDATGVWNVKS